MNRQNERTDEGRNYTPKNHFKQFPSRDGFFGPYGGSFVPPDLQPHLDRLTEEYLKVRVSADYLNELKYIRKHYQGRPTPVYFARNLSDKIGGARIYLKREDLNHTGAHKLNHCMAEGLLAKHMGKRKLIAETGAGQHGVALATAAAYFGMDCEIHMGEIDIAKEHPNVIRMKLLGAKVVPVTFGGRSLKEAVDSAFGAYLEDPENMFFGLGSVVGPHPYPMMVRDFQRIVGEEARAQFLDMTDGLPDHIMACVGGGSNAMGLFSGFIEDEGVNIIAVEARGRSDKLGDHAATVTFGRAGMIHGFKSLLLQDDDGEAATVHSIASGLDHPVVGPEPAFLNDVGRLSFETATDDETLDAFYTLSRLEGIIPALESAHAVAYAMKFAKDRSGQSILVNLSGRGDKDIDYISENFGYGGDEESDGS